MIDFQNGSMIKLGKTDPPAAKDRMPLLVQVSESLEVSGKERDRRWIIVLFAN